MADLQAGRPEGALQYLGRHSGEATTSERYLNLGLMAEQMRSACSLDQLQLCYEHAVLRDPVSWYAHAGFLALACEKWFGSHEAMYAVARSAAEGAPDGDARHLLICLAHLERWVYAAHFEDEPDAAAQLLGDSAVHDEVRAAMARYAAAPNDTLDGHLGRNAAAAWHFLVRDPVGLKAAFGALPIYFDIPWVLLGGRDAYKQAREWVGP